MTVGEVFARAWELWKKDIGWLILAGLVVGLIVGVVAIVVFAIVAGMAAVSIGGIAIGANGNSTSLTGLGVGTLIGAFVVGFIGYLIVSVLSMVFYGGVFEMVIGAAREGRGVNFVDVFSGFRKFGKFLIFWLVMVGVGLVCAIVAFIPIIGIIADMVFLAWLAVTWIYVLPLIADRGMTFGEAAKTSSAMVKGTGWWKTLGLVAVLMVAIFVIGIVIGLIGRVSSALNGILTLALEIVAGPFIICYVSTMYLEAGGEAAVVTAPGMPGAPIPPPPGVAPYASPAVGGQAYQPAVPPPAPPAAPAAFSPGVAAGAATPLGAAGATDAAAATMAAANAWKAAADPLAAGAPPAAVPVEAAAAALAPAVEESQTAVTDAAGEAAGDAAGETAPDVTAATAAAAPVEAAAETVVTDVKAPPAPEPPKAPPAPGT